MVAYRRLAGADGDARSTGLGGETERFVLRAAALRVRHAGGGGGDPAACSTTPRGDPHARHLRAAPGRPSRCGDDYLGRFAHYIHQAVVDGQPDEARQLEVLRMRLMRDFATLWLLAYKRLIAEAALEGRSAGVSRRRRSAPARRAGW